jgi:aspartate racemase
MKKLGLVGGTSWVSTIEYYRMINCGINEILGGFNFAECMIYSLNYNDIVKNNEANYIEGNFHLVLNAAKHLKNAGADAIVLCANTMHMFAEKVEEEIKLPVIHIAVATAIEIEKHMLNKVALLGTKYTMELGFFKSKLRDRHIDCITPEKDESEFIHHTIFNDLGKGIIKDETKSAYIAIINSLIKKGAQGIILGCTEIPLLIKTSDVDIPLFDTTQIHSAAAVKFAVG